jgi:hypothetical protein
MSEFPPGATVALDADPIAFGGDATIDDIDSLACSVEGQQKSILHYLDRPKPWEAKGWIRLAGTDYVRLMRRLLFAEDIPLRVDPGIVPVWLRPTRVGQATLRALGSGNRVIVTGAHVLPHPIVERLREVRRKI